MAKIKVLGDMIQVISNITEDEMKKIAVYKPEALQLRDENNEPVFAVETGPASLSKFGVSFCSTDFDGKLFLTIANPIEEHVDADEEKKQITEDFATFLRDMEKIERQVADAMTEANALEQRVSSSVEMVEETEVESEVQ